MQRVLISAIRSSSAPPLPDLISVHYSASTLTALATLCERSMWYSSFHVRLALLNITSFSFIHFTKTGWFSFSLVLNNIPLCLRTSFLWVFPLYPGLIPQLSYSSVSGSFSLAWYFAVLFVFSNHLLLTSITSILFRAVLKTRNIVYSQTPQIISGRKGPEGLPRLVLCDKVSR